ncbi:HK97 gp10 family phage protein [Streptomyces sp. H27-D2]|uniref:HK97 gp10 family phage protein n=1 Tax=Streptomyces sp. H27-D2 TaxID=3046304 RepID=UPI002DB9B238|nr:HK97 gp10 family phage protein [Streptomyces sp. H27-D2]MEC4016095.1 HK97 gp10 family phage protein [Streptomyces sp. H27-D2]
MADVDVYEDAIASLALHPSVQADLAARMDRVVEVAQAIAPVDTGAFRASIYRDPDPDPDGTVYVVADVHYAIYVEHGTRQTDRNGRSIHPPRFTLTTALDAAGGDH